MTKPLLLVTSLILALFTSQHALALCGDVTGDGARSASDALAVLRSAVGQPVDLVCEDSGPSKLRYYNDFTCQSGSSVSQATFNGLTFEADAGATSDYQTVDLTEISTIEISLCGGTYNFAGPLNLPPNRAITFFMVFADPAVYAFGACSITTSTACSVDEDCPNSETCIGGSSPAFFVMNDDGAPAAALTSGSPPQPGKEIAVLFGRGKRTAP